VLEGVSVTRVTFNVGAKWSKDLKKTAYASASGDAICCDGGGVRGVEQSTNIGRFG
jgi:hypothetical protein